MRSYTMYISTAQPTALTARSRSHQIASGFAGTNISVLINSQRKQEMKYVRTVRRPIAQSTTGEASTNPMNMKRNNEKRRSLITDHGAIEVQFNCVTLYDNR